MATLTSFHSSLDPSSLASVNCTASQWYAAYVCANHEKRVAKQLGCRSVEHFLPLYPSVRLWKDRRMQLELPLFPGYIFVRMELGDRLRVLQTPGVVHLVGFGGRPVALPEEEVARLREGLTADLRPEPWTYLTTGRQVRILRGPLEGFQGILLRRKGRLRFVLSLDLIRRSIIADVDVADLAPVGQRGSTKTADEAMVPTGCRGGMPRSARIVEPSW